jgi:hypothetical protein
MLADFFPSSLVERISRKAQISIGNGGWDPFLTFEFWPGAYRGFLIELRTCRLVYFLSLYSG